MTDLFVYLYILQCTPFTLKNATLTKCCDVSCFMRIYFDDQSKIESPNMTRDALGNHSSSHVIFIIILFLYLLDVFTISRCKSRLINEKRNVLETINKYIS